MLSWHQTVFQVLHNRNEGFLESRVTLARFDRYTMMSGFGTGRIVSTYWHTYTGPCFKVYANNGSLHPHLMNTMNVSTAFGSTASGETLIKARTNLRGIPSKASNGQDILSTSKQTMAPSPQTRSRSSWSKFTMKLQLNCEKKNLFGGRDWCERRNLHDP